MKTKQNTVKSNKMSSIQNVATKRLHQDWAECQSEPIPGITASPIESNIFQWHANLKGPQGTPWERGIFHLVMTFPKSYPIHPPVVEFCSRIHHPNIINNTLCIDMLEKRTGDTHYRGWSSAYTVQSILIQLQAFLFDAEPSEVLKDIVNPQEYDKKAKEWLSGISYSVDQSLRYHDNKVGHHPPKSPWPQFREAEPVTKTIEEVVQSEYKCFFTRQTYKQECLGVGISYSKNMRTGEINNIYSTPDYISLNAFMNHKVRTTSTNVQFTHWMPIYIDGEHGQKAFYLAKRALNIICTGSSKSEFQPEFAFEVFPKLMSTQVVEVANGRKHASLVALRSYCLFHRMFLEFANQFPCIKQKCNQVVGIFIHSEQKRHKDITPNLGDFLAILSVSDYTWQDVRSQYIQESFARQAYWILQKHPELEQLDNPQITDQDRVDISFSISQVSQKLILFHSFFMNHVVRPRYCIASMVMDMSHDDATNTIHKMIHRYDSNYGQPSQQTENEFTEHYGGVMNIKNYQDFFSLLQLDNDYAAPTNQAQMADILKNAIMESKQKGYHGSTLNVLSPEEFSKQSKNTDLCQLLDNMNSQHDDNIWKEACRIRWGFDQLPDYLSKPSISMQWRKFYLQHNLQDLLSNINDAPDIKNLHQVLDQSTEIPRLEIQMFLPTNIKSKYHFITSIISKLKNLDTLLLTRGSATLNVDGFKALVKGLSPVQSKKGVIGGGGEKLTALVLNHCGINAPCVELLTRSYLASSVLTRLILSNNLSLGDQGAVHLGHFLRQHVNLPLLEELDLSNCNISVDGANSISEVILVKKHLKILKLADNQLGDGLAVIVKNLSYSSSIQQVDLSRVDGNFGIQGESIVKLIQLTRTLRCLNLWMVKDVSKWFHNVFDQLSINETITRLNLGETKFRNLSLLGRALANNRSIEFLDLAHNNITASDVYMLFNELIARNSSMSGVKELILANNNFGSYDKEAHIKSIGYWLNKSPNLIYLDMTGCDVEGRHMDTIGFALAQPSCKLETLLLRGNKIKKNAIKALSSALEVNNTVSNLDLSGNQLGVQGANLIMNMLHHNKCITDLNLYGNMIEIEGAIFISSALSEKNKSIKHLDMGLNNIKARGAYQISQMLKKNTTIERLRLKSNNIPDKTARVFVDSIIECSSVSNLKLLALGGNLLSDSVSSEMSLKFNQCDILKNKGFVFDMAKLAEVKSSERLERTIHVCPLPVNVTEQMIKKLFYTNKCGVCLSVNIIKYKSFKKSKYAFVEFAHPDSVQLAMRLSNKKLNKIAGKTIQIARAGITNTGKVKTSNKTTTSKRKRIGEIQRVSKRRRVQ
ncbi:ubiquitin conjugating enzyme E2 [Acrasis kona]|uniref:Ubiquitin conjugating enzyme E2 n=1 Tax=Acrasis kona TaxID=1008807 RepID=A0AAW2Z1S0_9EUKA